jgi:osmoprotectant transport system substrate-binding protein/osmoprotectant transport system permease protein
MRRLARLSVLVSAALTCVPALAGATLPDPPPVRGARFVVGSKAFPESWVLGEALATLARREGLTVEHRSNLGGTEIVFQALRSSAVDAYPEYTGTISEVILHRSGHPSLADMRAALAEMGVGISEPLGFNDGYALAVTNATADRLGVKKLSDLARHPELRLGLTHEFLGRPDGYPGLARAYDLRLPNVRGIQHELAYGAIASGNVDVIDIYTTDAQIARLGLRVLEDDRGFFPRYDAVWLYRLDLESRSPAALAAMRTLERRIDEATMIAANVRVVLGGQTPAQSADSLLLSALPADSSAAPIATASKPAGVGAGILANTIQHLKLVGLSLLAAILIGVPLGVLAARARWLAAATLTGAGLLQTIPSLALLAFLIPLLGIGVGPALVALFLYSLLPIVRNTYVGLTTIPPALTESAAALGLSPTAQLWRVRLPMASPAIMAGIKTSAVINVGTATLAALIGAGGLGDPILAGIQLRRTSLILEGAVPAALLALVVQWAFDGLDRLVIPRGLRLPSAN